MLISPAIYGEGCPTKNPSADVWRSVRDLRDVRGVSKEANTAPESWRDRAFREVEQGASRQSMVEVLPAHDAETTSPSKVQHRLGGLVNRVCLKR